MIKDYDKWKLDCGIGVEKVVYYCEECGKAIYEGEPIYTTNEGIIHEDCLEDFCYRFLEYSLTYAEKGKMY